VLVSIAVVLPLAVVIADRMGQRLRRAARTANRIAAGDLDDRIGETGRARDEIAELSAAVDSMAASLQARIVTEQRFTADVAHELRTPLTGLTTAAELLPESEAAGYVRDRVRVLRTLVEDLLEVSRLDAAKETAELAAHPLARLVARSVARTGLDADVRVGGDVLVRTDPRRLDRILGNLVGNAHRHGRGPVEVCVEGPVVTVRDHGEGFPADLLRDGPQRFRTGAAERGGGYGLGLTIAAGQARLIGAELTFSNAVDGGATATLVLPIHD
jgi:signal transduction histidine kinase